jgi:hypothetical protein
LLTNWIFIGFFLKRFFATFVAPMEGDRVLDAATLWIGLHEIYAYFRIWVRSLRTFTRMGDFENGERALGEARRSERERDVRLIAPYLNQLTKANWLWKGISRCTMPSSACFST